MEWPLTVRGSQSTDEVVFECLYGSFFRNDSVICWFHKFPSAIFAFEIYFEWINGLIIGDVECRLVPFLCQLFEYLVETFNSGGIFDI